MYCCLCCSLSCVFFYFLFLVLVVYVDCHWRHQPTPIPPTPKPTLPSPPSLFSPSVLIGGIFSRLGPGFDFIPFGCHPAPALLALFPDSFWSVGVWASSGCSTNGVSMEFTKCRSDFRSPFAFMGTSSIFNPFF